MTFHYLHPTRGSILLGNWSSNADGTVDFPGRGMRCGWLYMRKTGDFFNTTIQARDSEGRAANLATSGLYNACSPFAAP